jgi:hypothetical protein
MQVSSIIQPAATVIRVTEVKPGDVYQRLVKATYSGDKDKVVFGMVMSVLVNGEDAAITAIEFTPPMYAGFIEPEVKVFSGGTDVALFPATVEEWDTHMRGAISKQAKEVEKIEATLRRQSEVLEQMQSALFRDKAEALTVETTAFTAIEN